MNYSIEILKDKLRDLKGILPMMEDKKLRQLHTIKIEDLEKSIEILEINLHKMK